MTKLWRRTPKANRAEEQLDRHFRNAKHPSIQLVGLLRKAKVPVVPAHEYSPEPKVRNLDGRLLGPTEIRMHAELKREGIHYKAREPYMQLARERDKAMKEVPVES